MILLSKFIRGSIKFVRETQSTTRKSFYKLAYESIHFESGVFLNWGVKIHVTDGGILRIGENTHIDRYVTIRINGGSVVIGPNSYIGEFCYIASSDKVIINKGALIASHVVIRDNQHVTDDLHKPIYKQGNESLAVKIGDNVWIGTKATILLGVSIGSNTIIGAHSLVKNNQKGNSVCAGIPCKFIKYRKNHVS